MNRSLTGGPPESLRLKKILWIQMNHRKKGILIFLSWKTLRRLSPAPILHNRDMKWIRIPHLPFESFQKTLRTFDIDTHK